jgi:hypothetical protein
MEFTREDTGDLSNSFPNAAFKEGTYAEGEPWSLMLDFSGVINAWDEIYQDISNDMVDGALRNDASGTFFNLIKKKHSLTLNGPLENVQTIEFWINASDTRCTLKSTGSIVSLESGTLPDGDFLAVQNGTGTVAQEKSVASQIDWNEPVGDAWTWHIITKHTFGAVVGMQQSYGLPASIDVSKKYAKLVQQTYTDYSNQRTTFF